MEVINNFERGLHRSNIPTEQPEGSYPEAVNWVRNDRGSLTNEELEEILLTLPEKPMGYTTLNGETIFLFKSSVGTFTKDAGFTLIANFPFSDITEAVDIKSRIGLDNHRLIYFVEKGKYIRRMDLDNPGTTVDDYELQLNFSLPEIQNITINSSGNLPTGVYYLAARYITNGGNKTAAGLISNPIPIVDGIRNNNSDNYDGAPPGSPSNKSITFNVGNNDTTYPYMEILVATYEGITNVLTTYSIGTFNNNTSSITFSDTSQFVDRVPLEELTTNPTFYQGAGCIEQKDNILVLSNLSSKKRDTDIQEIANKIKVFVVPKYITYTESILGLPADDDANSDYTGTTIDTGINNFIGTSKDEIYLKDFQRGETYSFAITPIYTDGSKGFAYPIPALNNGVTIGSYKTTYVSANSLNNRYPSNYGTISNLPVYNHLMPDVDEIPLYQTDTLIQLTLKFDGIDFSSKPDVVGYIIGYQKRDSSLNTSILTEGIIRPIMKDSVNNNKWVAPLNGSFKVIDGGGTNSARTSVTTPEYTFLSADIIHGKDITPTKLEYLGIQKTFSKRIAKEGNASGKQVVEFISTLTSEGFLYKGVKRDILDTVDVPTIPFSDRLYTYNSNSNSFYLRGTKGFKHLSVNSTLLGTSDVQTSDGTTEYEFNIDTNDYLTKDTTDRSITNTYFKVLTGRLLNDFTTSANQYGRVENAEYCPLGYSLDKRVQSIIVGGDTYTQKYAFDVCEGVQDGMNDLTGTHGYIVVRGIIYSFIQSQNNFAYKHYEDTEVPYYPKYKVLYSETEPLGLGNIDHTKGYSTGYNRQYSAVNDLVRTVPKPTLFKEVTYYPNRSIYSEQAFENEVEDQYRVFLPNNFHDVPKDKGEITDTFVFNNDFYHHTTYGLWKSFLNPNTTQVTSQGEVVLGNGGVFKLPSIPIFDINGGYLGTYDRSGVNTPFGRFFIDHSQKKIFLFTGEAPREISDAGMYPFFREYLKVNSLHSIIYDSKYKRVLFSNQKDFAISYYPKTDTWTSFHTFSPNFYFTLNEDTFAIKDKHLFTLEGSKRKNTSITLITNSSPDAFKRFEEIQINSNSGTNSILPGSINSQTYNFNKVTFDKIHCWNETQNTTELVVTIPKDFEAASLFTTNEVYAQYFKGAFNVELPSDAVIDYTQDIFDPNNLDINREFREPLTGKFLYTKLSYNNNLPLVLNYVKSIIKSAIA